MEPHCALADAVGAPLIRVGLMPAFLDCTIMPPRLDGEPAGRSTRSAARGSASAAAAADTEAPTPPALQGRGAGRAPSERGRSRPGSRGATPHTSRAPSRVRGESSSRAGSTAPLAVRAALPPPTDVGTRHRSRPSLTANVLGFDGDGSSNGDDGEGEHGDLAVEQAALGS